LDPTAAFPIMMGSGAFVGTIAGVRFVGAGRFHWRAALGLTAAGFLEWSLPRGWSKLSRSMRCDGSS
jgi:hypothetical protein